MYNSIHWMSYSRGVFLISFLLTCISSVHLLEGQLSAASTDDMEQLLHTPREIVKSLERYLQSEEQRLSKIRQIVDIYLKLHFVANEKSQKSQTFLASPINVYVLVKRLTTDWKQVEEQLIIS